MNALSPIVSKEDGKEILVRLLQDLKAKSPNNVKPSGRDTLLKPSQFKDIIGYWLSVICS